MNKKKLPNSATYKKLARTGVKKKLGNGAKKKTKLAAIAEGDLDKTLSQVDRKAANYSNLDEENAASVYNEDGNFICEEGDDDDRKEEEDDDDDVPLVEEVSHREKKRYQSKYHYISKLGNTRFLILVYTSFPKNC